MLPTILAMTTAEPTKDLAPGVRIDADMVLSVTEDGELVVIHRRLVDPVVIDMTQLRNWLRRQLREIV